MATPFADDTDFIYALMGTRVYSATLSGNKKTRWQLKIDPNKEQTTALHFKPSSPKSNNQQLLSRNVKEK